MAVWIVRFIVFFVTSVEEVEGYSAQLEPAVATNHLDTSLPPRQDLQIRAPICAPSPTQVPFPAPHSKRTPMPPPKPQRPAELDDPNFRLDMGSEVKDSMYFILSPTGESVPQDGPQGAYEELGYDEEELNRNPPPVWKPAPPPEVTHDDPLSRSSSSIVYSRVEAANFINQPRRAMKYETSTTNSRDVGARRRSPHPRPKPTQPEAPPTRPKATLPPHQTVALNTMKGVMNDPALKGKLQEKRQELYGAVDRASASVSSCGSPNPMENYEEVCFDLASAASNNEEEDLPPVFSRDTNMTLPPRRHNIGSEIVMMQCPQETPRAQEYLSFQPSPSHSPQGSTSDLSKRESQTSVHLLSHHLQRKSLSLPESLPQLPPRDAQRMREGSPHLVRKPISPAALQHPRPAVPPPVAPHARPKKPLRPERSSSQENLHHAPTTKSRGLPPRPISSSFESPPPVPHRNQTPRDEFSFPNPPVRGSMPPPSVSTGPQPAPRHHQVPIVRHPSSELASPPPLVPVRQPKASGASLSAGELRCFPDEDAPPVPSRGAREKTLLPNSSTPSLHSSPETSSNPRPPVRPAHVGEIDPQVPAQAWDERASANSRIATSRLLPHTPAITMPRVSTKPAVTPKPRIASKPVVSAKPPTSTKPTVNPKPQVAARSNRPPHTVRNNPTMAGGFPASHQNGEIPPPIPPR